MEVKSGYKQTEVGVIPEDWAVIPMSELFTFQNGVNADKAAYGKGIPFINVLEVITHSTLTEARIPGRISLPPQTSSAFRVQTGDVLFNRTSETQEEVGLASVYVDNREVVFGGFVIRARPRNGSLNPMFSSYALRSPLIRQQIVSRGQGAVRANIGQQDLSKVRVFVPPIPEQEAIAEVLSNADALIGTLERLIAKKRLLKQGVMRELLTGRWRLRGFANARAGYKQTEVGVIPEDWTLLALADLGAWKGGATPSMRNPMFWANGSVPWVSSGDIKSALICDTPMKITETAIKQSSTTLLPPNSIMVVTRSGILRRYLPVAKNTVPMAINQDIKALITNDNVVADFVLHQLISNGKLILATCLKVGTTVESIEFSWLKAFKIPLPPTKAEQEAIAEVLSAMDAEIALLEAQLAKYRQLKHGLMQKLLTGRIRLV